ncbi:methyl-accepting chemotaxis protein [Alkaliphilus crotonatoxidans]
MEKAVQYFIEMAPTLQNCFDEDVIIGISDLHTFLKYLPGKELDIRAKEGEPLQPGEAMFECIKTGNRIIQVIPKEAFGIPFKSVTVPIQNEAGSTVGSISIGRSLKNQNRHMELTQNVAAALEEITASIDEISGGADRIAASMENVQLHGDKTNEQVAATDKILQYIKNISDQTNMLGLNAAIEAARAGEHGRGFSVVAEEIRKLSQETKTSVGSINEVLQSIKDSVAKTAQLLQDTRSITQNQVESTQQIVGALQELNATSQLLAQMAKDL